MDETDAIEFKADIDLTKKEHKLKLIKEIVAMANAEGGTIEIGRADDGTVAGLPKGPASRFDAARVSDLVNAYIEPDSVEVHTEIESLGESEHCLVKLHIRRTRQPPLVFSKPGNYQDERGEQQILFRAHSVYKRDGTKADVARWRDFRRWTEEAVSEAQNSFLDKVGLLVRADPESSVRIVTGERIDSPPQFLLSQSTLIFEQRPEKLLSGDDLLFLWRNRGSLQIDGQGRDLVLQSALRRKATLFLWLWYLEPEPDEVMAVLVTALDAKDRDKSDAAKSILQVGSIYAMNDEYQGLRRRMSESSYAHMKSAAADLQDRTAALVALRLARSKGLVSLSDRELESKADQESASDSPASRSLSGIGLELLSRKQEF